MAQKETVQIRLPAKLKEYYENTYKDAHPQLSLGDFSFEQFITMLVSDDYADFEEDRKNNESMKDSMQNLGSISEIAKDLVNSITKKQPETAPTAPEKEDDNKQ
jgi:hypothetical protein